MVVEASLSFVKGILSYVEASLLIVKDLLSFVKKVLLVVEKVLTINKGLLTVLETTAVNSQNNRRSQTAATQSRNKKIVPAVFFRLKCGLLAFGISD
jgi:hypothetical protein